MDGLKFVNDTYGHMEGDVALKAFANVISHAAGDNGMSFRVGGDEFMILASTSEPQVILDIVQKVEEGIVKYNESVEKPYELAGSIGYSMYKKGEEISNCIRRADVNMYADKVSKKHNRR